MDINLELNRIMMKALERTEKPVPERTPCGRCGGQGEIVTVRHRGDEDEEEDCACCPSCAGDGFTEYA
jgi:DnaJ-class molecular chaperone